MKFTLFALALLAACTSAIQIDTNTSAIAEENSSWSNAYKPEPKMTKKQRAATYHDKRTNTWKSK